MKPKSDREKDKKKSKGSAPRSRGVRALALLSVAGQKLGRTPTRAWLVIGIVFCAVELSLLHPVPFAVSMKSSLNPAGLNTSLPINGKQKYDDQEFSVQMNVWISLLTNRTFTITPDDCVTAVHVNGELISLGDIPESARCDWRKGFELPLGKYLSLGSNQLRFQVKNKDGEWGFRVETATAKQRWWSLIAALVILTSILLSSLVGFAAKQVRRSLAIPAFVVLVIGYCTYFDGYWEPRALFWDENYHITAAQKYLNGVFFMEPHPPLGKLLIALGEDILSPNAQTNQFIDTENASVPNQDISFAGYRLIPALLAWWSALLFFLVLHALTRQPWLSLCLCTLYLFDNALIVHLRGAMLDSTMIFFSLGCIFALIKAYQGRHKTRTFVSWLVVAGVAYGAGGATKVLALIWILLLPVVLWRAYQSIDDRKKLLFGTGGFFASALFVFLTVWQIHFALGQEVRPKLADKGFYQADAAYQQVIRRGEGGSLLSFPLALKNHLKFFPHYTKGVPKLNLCKMDNGSPFFFWPFGARTINYRWATQNAEATQYLYLVPNPFNWFLGLSGLILAASRITGMLFGPRRSKSMRNAPAILLVIVYAAYMISMARIPRVMYLYHYFLPLLLTYLIFGLELRALPRVANWKITRALRQKIAFGIAVGSFAVFLVYSPLTYYRPITPGEISLRSALAIWDIRCNNCPYDNGYYAPVATESSAPKAPAVTFPAPDIAKN